MKNSIINKLLKKHEEPVEKLVPPVPITAENIQKILPAVGLAARAAAPMIGRAVGAGAKAAKPQLAQAGKTALDTGAKTFGTEMGTSAAKKVKDTMSKQSFDTLFTKQNPALASQMAKRGLIFDRISHRWKKKPENRAQPQTVSTMPSAQRESERISHEINQERNRKTTDFVMPPSGILDREEIARKARSADDLPDYDIDVLQNHRKAAKRSPHEWEMVQIMWKERQDEKAEWDFGYDIAGKDRQGKNTANSWWVWSESPSPRKLTSADIKELNELTDWNYHSQVTAFLARRIGEPKLAWEMEKMDALGLVMGGWRVGSKESRAYDKLSGKIRDLVEERITNSRRIL